MTPGPVLQHEDERQICSEAQEPANLAYTTVDKRPSYSTNKVESFTQAAQAYIGTHRHTHIYYLGLVTFRLLK